MKRLLNTSEHGFTLIEVIMSIAILSIVSVIVLRLFVTSHELNEESRTTDLAGNAAVNVIESIKGYRNLESFLDSNDWYHKIDTGYLGQLTYDSDFTPAAASDDSSGSYVVESILQADRRYDNLYEIEVSVYHSASLLLSSVEPEPLVTFTAKHYFMEGVAE